MSVVVVVAVVILLGKVTGGYSRQAGRQADRYDGRAGERTGECVTTQKCQERRVLSREKMLIFCWGTVLWGRECAAMGDLNSNTNESPIMVLAAAAATATMYLMDWGGRSVVVAGSQVYLCLCCFVGLVVARSLARSAIDKRHQIARRRRDGKEMELVCAI